MSLSAFGIDHGEISKATDPNTGKKPSAGRRVLASAYPVFHGAAAGKKGKKLRAVGNEYGGSLAGGTAGGLAGAALTRGRALGVYGGAIGGGITGSQLGLNRNQKKGYLKREDAE